MLALRLLVRTLWLLWLLWLLRWPVMFAVLGASAFVFTRLFMEASR